MPWIESHTALAHHPKTLRLARTLGVSVPQAIGHLHLLWWWAMEYAQNGELGAFDPDEIAIAAMWEGDGAEFYAALHTARFVDADHYLHDWEEYAGKLLDRRQVNAERMREARARRSASMEEERAEHVHSTFDARVGLPDHTGPTIPDQPDQPYRAAFAAQPESISKKLVEELYQHYKLKIQPLARAPADKQIRTVLGRFSPQEVFTSIDHFAASTWAMEHNADKGAAWFFEIKRIEHYLLKNPEKEQAHGAPRRHPAARAGEDAAGLEALAKY